MSTSRSPMTMPPGPTLARRMGIRRYQYDAKTRTLSKPMDVIMGLPTHDDHVGGRLVDRPRPEAVSHHRGSGKQLRRKPLQRQSCAGPSHDASGESAGLVQLSGQDPSTESRRLDPRRQSRRSTAFAATSSPTAIAIRSDSSSDRRARSTSRSTDRTPTTRST